MNFVDAAVAILAEAGQPLHVEELCRQAVERELLDNPGKAPLRSFKGRLTTELKRGDDSRVARVEPDVWALSETGQQAAAEPAAAEPAPAKRAPRRKRQATEERPADTGEGAAAHAAAEAIEQARQEDGERGDEETIDATLPPPSPPPQLSDEEKALVEIYGDDTETAKVGELTEYRDAQTADEDRVMMPELRARRGRDRDREDRKSRRDRTRKGRRDRRGPREHDNGRERPPRQEEVVQRASPPPTGTRPTAIDRDQPGKAALSVLGEVKVGQAVPAKQLGQMMRKRNLLSGDPDKASPLIKAALLNEHRRLEAEGRSDRIVHRGRDLFAYRPSPNSELRAAEEAVHNAAAVLRGATERALAAQLADLPLGALQQLAHLFLVARGFHDIQWIKQVERSSYAVVQEAGEGPAMMVAVRAGNQEVDRRGVGELRAGVEAKGLARGLLMAPRELGGEARAELERGDTPVQAMCGLVWIAQLVELGVGVVERRIPVRYLDTELFDRLAD